MSAVTVANPSTAPEPLTAARVEGPGMCCSCCKRTIKIAIQVALPRTARPREYVRWCRKCVVAVSAAKEVGRELRRRPGGFALTVKRWRVNGEEAELCCCVHHHDLAVGGEAVALWHNGHNENVCAACVDRMVAALASHDKETGR